mgnify:CR=1 FL=1
MSFEKIEKENLTNDLIQQDIINGFKNDSHITTNIILIIVGIFFCFLLCFSYSVRMAVFVDSCFAFYDMVYKANE